MITWIRTALINPGKRTEAIAWALNLSRYVNDKFDTNITVHGNVIGPINQIYWVTTYESMDAFEQAAGKIVQDRGYNELLEASSEAQLYNAQSFKDTFYQPLGE